MSTAADDPDVLAIKQTLYRMGGDSSIAARWSARRWPARRSPRSWSSRPASTSRPTSPGPGPSRRPACRSSTAWQRKTHTKMLLVVRREGEVLRRYCHIGTGNYNSSTARSYEDLGLLTSDRGGRRRRGRAVQRAGRVGQGSRPCAGWWPPRFTTRRVLMDASMRSRGPGRPVRIIMKTNGLTDPAVIDGLYQASQAGCRGRPRRPRPVLPAARSAGAVRAHHRTVDRGPLSRALAHLPVRRDGRSSAAPLHRVGRPDGAEPRPAGGGARPGGRPGSSVTGCSESSTPLSGTRPTRGCWVRRAVAAGGAAGTGRVRRSASSLTSRQRPRLPPLPAPSGASAGGEARAIAIGEPAPALVPDASREGSGSGLPVVRPQPEPRPLPRGWARWRRR